MPVRVIAGFFGVMWLVAGWACADTIGLYGDSQGTQCDIVDNAARLLPIYVVHVSTLGAIGCEFWAPKPTCMVGAIWLSDTDPFGMFLGTTQTGVTIPYGPCKTGPILATVMNFFGRGTSEPCCSYPVLGHPYLNPSSPRAIDCANQGQSAVGLMGTINGTAGCPCGNPVPAEETTWGRVKALYTE
jgi:hypothetical protein